MEHINRREVMKLAAASIAGAVVGGALNAAEPEHLGAGPCTRCPCKGFEIGNGNICSNPGCKHPYSAHKVIHRPRT